MSRPSLGKGCTQAVDVLFLLDSSRVAEKQFNVVKVIQFWGQDAVITINFSMLFKTYFLLWDSVGR